MKARLATIFHHPLVIVPPLILGLILGWQYYAYAGRDLSLPSTHNALPNSDFAQLATNGVPVGWTLHKTGSADYRAGKNKGYVGGNTFVLTTSDYKDGGITLTSPKVPVKASKTYLFKGYYKSDIPFALLMHSYAADGSDTQQLVRTYPGDAGIWSTASHAFQPSQGTVAVQFTYQLYANGQLQLNGLYLEPQSNVYIPPTAIGPNVAPNSNLSSSSYDTPQDWYTYHSGESAATFTYQQSGTGPYMEARVSAYKSGQSKWQYAPQPVKPDQYYQVRIEYRSNAAVPLIAEYLLQNGKREYQTITQLPPADKWTVGTFKFQTVPDATTMTLSIPLERSGTVASRNYTLTDISRTDAVAYWEQPIVSISFDDGWQQAYKNALPILKSYNYAATFYVNPSTIETPGFMNASQLSTLAHAGNEIGAHGYEHDDLTTIKTSALDYQLRKGRDYLRNAGFEVHNLATPYGRSDAEVRWYAKQYFATLRGVDTGINTRQNLDPYDLRVINITAQTTAKDIAALLEQTKNYHGWTILSYHQVQDGAQDYGPLHVERSSITISSLKQHMKLIHASGLKVLPVAAAYQMLERPAD